MFKDGRFHLKNAGQFIYEYYAECVCFLISTIICEIYYRVTGKKYDGLLGEYHKKQKLAEK